MALGRHLRELWRLRLGVICSVALALVAAIWSVYEITLFPPGVKPRAVEMAAASTRVLVDTPQSTVADLSVQTDDFKSLTNRALLVSNVMASAPVRAYIARRAQVPASVIEVASPVTPSWPRPLSRPGSQQRKTSDIFKSPDEYRLSLKSNPTVPVIDVYAQAPTALAAQQLANGAVAGMQDYLRDLGREDGVRDVQQVHLEQLGRATGSVISSGVGIKVMLLTFVLVLMLSSVAVVALSRIREGWRAEAAAERSARLRGGRPQTPAAR